MKYLLVVVSLVGLLVALGVRSASAQVATPAPVTSVDVLVLPAVGDPVVTAPLATRNTILTLASARRRSVSWRSSIALPVRAEGAPSGTSLSL